MVDNSIPLTIVLGIALFFLSLTTIAVIIIIKKFYNNTLRANFISSGGYITSKRYRMKNVKETISFNEGTYIYNPANALNTSKGREIFYFEGIPDSIKISGDIKNLDTTKITSSNLKTIIETELINKLFKQETFSLNNILIIVSIIIGVIGLVLIFSLYNSGVKINPSENNIEILRSLIRSALATGV